MVRWCGGAFGSVLYAWALKSLPVKRSCYDLERTMCLSMRAWEPGPQTEPSAEHKRLNSSRVESKAQTQKTDTQRAYWKKWF